MLNKADAVSEEMLKVLDVGALELTGQVNVSDETLLANVQSSIRRRHPQMRPQPANRDRVVLVGGGPSLADTEDELIELVREGAKLVTVNGAYKWCLERNLVPKSQIVMDARPLNAEFLSPYIESCNYALASQCAPESWDAVEGRKNVWIFHAATGTEGEINEVLDRFYLGQWFGVGGGITVVTRAISLLRMLGYLRFDLFGVDSCFLHGQHHAYAQSANDRDKPFPFRVGMGEKERTFYCAPWHVKQLECLLQLVKINGNHFLLNVHGDGLFAYALRTHADIDFGISLKG